MNLESWIHSVIKILFARDAEYRRFLNTNSLETITRSDVLAYQAYRLRLALRYCREKSAFYRDLFRTLSLEPEDICSCKDLAMLPFTEAHHLAEAPYRFLCTSQAEVARLYTFITSGTTGPKKKVFWTQGDLERITDFMAAGIGTVADADDAVLVMLPDGRPNSQADLLCKGVRKLGATPVFANIDLGAQELFKLIEEWRCSVIFGYTRNLFRLSKELQLQGDLRNKGVKVLFLASEYLPAAMRRELEHIWDCEVRTHYGLTEMGLGVAVECEVCNGYHFNEADLLLEVVDPRTGDPVPEGEEGELVFTTLNREAMPLIRYRTSDLSSILPGPCPCGALSLQRFDKVKKRLENLVTLACGGEMYPALFDDVLYEIPFLMDYQVIVTSEGGKDRLDFRIELMPESGPIEDIEKKLLSAPIIAENVAAGIMSPPRIEPVEPGSLRLTSRAKRMILDRR
ncbi:MAG: phenylacetate--CoA ligase family protein [Acidobacteria bacterium]|nr:phenylacetate--CoA ligase family protein [Acidobacteriota bacterium]